MDRVAFFLALCLCAPSATADGAGDWFGRPDLSLDPWRGIPTGKAQSFGTVLDDGANNGKITLAIAPYSDKRRKGYNLHYGTATGVYTDTWDCRKTLESGCTVSGLSNGTTYYFVATAYGVDPAIESGYSNEVSGAP
jgi:hypothetical protein